MTIEDCKKCIAFFYGNGDVKEFYDHISILHWQVEAEEGAKYPETLRR